MIEDRNTTVFHFSRPAEKHARGKQLPAGANVRLTVRCDIEDRNFHQETKRNGGAEYHFATQHAHRSKAVPALPSLPLQERQLRVFADRANTIRNPSGAKISRIRWNKAAARSAAATPTAPAGLNCRCPRAPASRSSRRRKWMRRHLAFRPAKSRTGRTRQGGATTLSRNNSIQAARAFVVRRDEGRTVIAGYPWFLDWGRDSLICARGLLAGGLTRR